MMRTGGAGPGAKTSAGTAGVQGSVCTGGSHGIVNEGMEASSAAGRPSKASKCGHAHAAPASCGVSSPQHVGSGRLADGRSSGQGAHAQAKEDLAICADMTSRAAATAALLLGPNIKPRLPQLADQPVQFDRSLAGDDQLHRPQINLCVGDS